MNESDMARAARNGTVPTAWPSPDDSAILNMAEHSAGFGHWYANREEGTLVWSDEVFQILGVDKASYSPDLESARAFYHPDDRERVVDTINAAYDERRSCEFECRMIRSDGEVRIIASHSSVDTDEHGRVRGLFGILQDITEKRRLEDALHASNERYEIALAAAHIGIWDLELESGRYYWSPEVEQLTGVAAKDVKPPFDALVERLHPDDRDRLVEAFAAHIAGGGPDKFLDEFRLRYKGNRYRWVQVRGQAYRDSSGGLVRMAGSLLDITPRKNEEHARRSIYEVASCATLEPAERIARMLNVARRHFRMAIATVNRVDKDLVTVDYIDAETSHINPGRQLEVGRTLCGETSQLNQLVVREAAPGEALADDLKPYGLSLSSYIGVPLYVAGVPYGTLAFRSFNHTGPELTSRHEAFLSMLAQWVANEIAQQQTQQRIEAQTEELKRKQDELDLIFDTVPIRIIYKDDQNNVLRLNQTAAETFGMDRAEIEGQSEFDLLPEMAESHHRADRQVVESGEPMRNIVEERMGPSGNRRWMRTDKIPFAAVETGEPRIIVVSQDITDLMEAQRELEQRTEQLGKAVKDLDDFAYIASHDLRAPMRGIETLAEWLEEDLGESVSDETRENLKLMRARVTRMNRMLGDVLDYSRAGKAPAEATNVDTAALCAEAATEAGAGGNFEVEIADGLPTVCVPEATLYRVLLELLKNAVEHHDGERGQIVVAHDELDADHIFTVTDDGPGIPEQYRERVFRVFETLKRRDEAEHSGIGLAIVRRLLGTIGGSVQVGAAPSGRGCVATFSLPKVQNPGANR